MENCPFCKAKMKEYKHTLNANLIAALLKFIKHGKPAKLADLNLTVNQHNNFQKLQYWGFVKKDSGKWYLQPLALEFFKGSVQVSRSVWTYRGAFKKFDDDLVTSDILKAEFFR